MLFHDDTSIIVHNISQVYSGITSGILLDGELSYTKILEVNMFAFEFDKCKQINF